MKYSVILLAGGIGSRTGQNIPKQFINIAGKPMIVHSLERFEKISEISEIIISCVKGYENKIYDYINDYALRKKIVVVPGGNTRQESVYNALEKVDSDFVIIHEAARPFVTINEFNVLINSEDENVTYGYSIPFSILKGKDKVEAIINRSEVFNVQLPQKFNSADLKKAYNIAISNKKYFTEDAGLLLECIGTQVSVINGSKYNIKITDDVDLLLANILYNEYILEGKFNE